MSVIPFAIRRPWLLLRDGFVNRDRPDLGRLGALRSPERFLWAILPHAARTFSACIAMLPASVARASAVAYLYCRILDTYEDLIEDAVEREAALAAFAARLRDGAQCPPPVTTSFVCRDARDRAHRLLVERSELVDREFLRLPAHHRRAIQSLVTAMAGGMCWASTAFRSQGGVLETEEQVSRYCGYMIGQPVLFLVRLLTRREPTPEQIADAMQVGEMIQLANVTRDIEKDLHRGCAYHPALRDDLGCDVEPPADVADRIRTVRGELIDRALALVPAYRRLVESLALSRLSIARASAVLMLQFTDSHYRRCVRRVGRTPWGGPRGKIAVIFRAAPALFSRRWTRRRMRRIERDFLAGIARK